ncbi:signal transduction histidine kinase [Nocardioides albertanoniae]|uniref:histidine kinase n=1 Tax=Nocardioides albertanoniae TaxID=1175486 RepID=A0A543A7H9_9ACTN|nr:histidine kinase [Nocardioides albertanoniae]TQL68548.1 signal transduction histidine kinase [Nocardioides albertanoniae]
MPLMVRSLDRTALLLGIPVLALSVFIAAVSLPARAALVVCAASLGAHLALALRLSRPRLGFAVVAACTGVLALTSGLFIVVPSVLTFPVALHTAVARGSRLDGIAAAGTGILGAAIGTWRFVTDASVRAEGLEPHAGFVLVTLLAVVAAAWALGQRARGDIARAKADQLRAEERVAAAARDERTRIAIEMHDVIAHSLAVIVSQARGAQYADRSDPQVPVDALTTIEKTGREALSEMRGIFGLLRDHQDGELAPAPALEDLPDLVARFPSARLSVVGTPQPLSPSRELAVYRAAQESLTNVVKHAGPEVDAAVTLTWSAARLVLQVTDHGGRAAAGGGAAGLGLAGMRYRVEALGGTATAGPQRTGGFAVTVSLPTEEEAR